MNYFFYSVFLFNIFSVIDYFLHFLFSVIDYFLHVFFSLCFCFLLSHLFVILRILRSLAFLYHAIFLHFCTMLYSVHTTQFFPYTIHIYNLLNVFSDSFKYNLSLNIKYDKILFLKYELKFSLCRILSF